ncbi:uncharacterized protein LOC130643047 [Hydractinia symbiolongicarpus]|uniref:uncharacterized protein LOC130643001 n=1 Tax=Hydractinia symbiolongicarpus TaxID=13093 RepID=UPI00254BA3AE|nr:uncharacterized protein LOC130643001 [Hydractinia symbiolongicarpus]XP_057305546.1 uncharacterized protein LOC130643047 [Hydractinia symbiolongicarpus]
MVNRGVKLNLSITTNGAFKTLLLFFYCCKCLYFWTFCFTGYEYRIMQIVTLKNSNYCILCFYLAVSFRAKLNHGKQVSDTIKNHESDRIQRFLVIETTKNVGAIDLHEKAHKIYWDVTGVPYMVLGRRYLDCHYGKDRQKLKKEKLKKICSPNSMFLKLKAVNFTRVEKVKVALRVVATFPATSCKV